MVKNLRELVADIHEIVTKPRENTMDKEPTLSEMATRLETALRRPLGANKDQSLTEKPEEYNPWRVDLSLLLVLHLLDKEGVIDGKKFAQDFKELNERFQKEFPVHELDSTRKPIAIKRDKKLDDFSDLIEHNLPIEFSPERPKQA